MAESNENKTKSLVSRTVILSRGERFKKITSLNTAAGHQMIKRIDSLKELFLFTRNYGTANHLVIDLKYSPELEAHTIRELRALGWQNILLILERRDQIKIKKLLKFKLEQIIIMPDKKEQSNIGAKMTDIELQIMQLLADGQSLSAIATKLHFSTQTIRRLLKKMLSRLGYSRRIRLLADLFREGTLK